MFNRNNEKRLVVDLPLSMLNALESLSARLGLTNSESLGRILEGLTGLDPSELRCFEEPRDKRRNSREFLVSASAFSFLDEFSLRSGFSRSVICRRILNGLLFTNEIGMFWDFDQKKYLLQQTQLVFPFSKKTDLLPR